nr:DUF4192 family protein [Amycolatopsis sp. RTGN1]
MGYVPADSLVLVAATARGDGTARMGPVTRFDLDTVVRHPGYVVAHLHPDRPRHFPDDRARHRPGQPCLPQPRRIPAAVPPRPADTRGRIAALADPITDEVEREELADDRPRLRRRLDRIDDAVTAATGSQLPTGEHVIADLLASLCSLRLRSIHLTQATAERAAAAHALWLHLWRHALERYAPDMAALVATTAYLRHDGSSAAAIFAKDPRPNQLSQLIHAMHRNGIDPATVDPDFATISQELRTELTTSAPDF